MSTQCVIGGETNNIIIKYDPKTTHELEDENTSICIDISEGSSFNKIQFKVNMRHVLSATQGAPSITTPKNSSIQFKREKPIRMGFLGLSGKYGYDIGDRYITFNNRNLYIKFLSIQAKEKKDSSPRKFSGNIQIQQKQGDNEICQLLLKEGD